MTRAQRLAAAVTNAYTDGKAQGIQEGIAIGRKEAIAEYEQQRHILSQQVFHLEGAAMLVKMLHEQLRLAGVPDYISRRS